MAGARQGEGATLASRVTAGDPLDPGVPAAWCARHDRGRCPLYVRGQLSGPGLNGTQMDNSSRRQLGP